MVNMLLTTVVFWLVDNDPRIRSMLKNNKKKPSMANKTLKTLNIFVSMPQGRGGVVITLHVYGSCKPEFRIILLFLK